MNKLNTTIILSVIALFSNNNSFSMLTATKKIAPMRIQKFSRAIRINITAESRKEFIQASLQTDNMLDATIKRNKECSSDKMSQLILRSEQTSLAEEIKQHNKELLEFVKNCPNETHDFYDLKPKLELFNYLEWQITLKE